MEIYSVVPIPWSIDQWRGLRHGTSASRTAGHPTHQEHQGGGRDERCCFHRAEEWVDYWFSRTLSEWGPPKKHPYAGTHGSVQSRLGEYVLTYGLVRDHHLPTRVLDKCAGGAKCWLRSTSIATVRRCPTRRVQKRLATRAATNHPSHPRRIVCNSPPSEGSNEIRDDSELGKKTTPWP